MAKCEDCIHNEVCDRSSRMMWAAMEGKTECDDFKDRSRYVVREKGEWKPVSRVVLYGFDYVTETHHKCSVCKEESRFYENFCPNCGSDMRKGENDG